MSGAGGYVLPGNAQARHFFYAALSTAEQERVRVLSVTLYDGTRTVAQAWRDAMDQVRLERRGK